MNNYIRNSSSVLQNILLSCGLFLCKTELKTKRKIIIIQNILSFYRQSQHVIILSSSLFFTVNLRYWYRLGLFQYNFSTIKAKIAAASASPIPSLFSVSLSKL